MSIRLAAFLLATTAASGMAVTTAAAQTDVSWVTFSKQDSKLSVPPLADPSGHTALSDNDTQIAFRTGDLNQDGWDDVVALRKQQGSQLGKRTAVLLMNIDGVLTDQTALYATASTVAGDGGFLTPCNSYECAIGDVNGDGWPDVVTCAALSDGAPKSISHPRVYINLGNDGGGNWLGLRHEDARIPQLLTVGGLAVAPRFSGLALADVTGDGFPDLYFVDFDSTETAISEPVNWDLNDRLLVNDGNGYFTDQSATAFTATQLKSGFGSDVEALDLNDDGANDIVKVNMIDIVPPTLVRALYNDPADVGNFTTMGVSDFGTSSPLGIDAGDLNHDAFKDVAIADDNADKFRLGTGFDGLNQMTWGPLKPFTFVTGADDGFGNHVHLRDLDGDGWNDVLITSVHIDLLGCGRRLHIYHNTGSIAGDMNLVLKEESELANGGTGSGWKGVVGITAADEKGCYDVGFGDFDKDGDLDILLGTCNGTSYWQNETNSVPPLCQTDLGFAGPGSMEFSVCGDDLTTAGSVATLSLTGAAPNQPIFLPVALAANPVPLKGGTLVPNPVLALLTGLTTSGAGSFTAPIGGALGTNVHLILQCLVKNGATWEFSNALDVLIGF